MKTNNNEIVKMESINQTLFLMLNADTHAPLFIVKIATFLSEWPVGIAIFLTALVVIRQDRDKKRIIGQIALTVLLAMITAFVIREIWSHPRPFVLGLGKAWVTHDSTPSLPSFHATFLFSLGFSLFCSGIGRFTAIVILILGGVTAWARIYVGIHFPFDMLAALVVGLLASLTVGRIANAQNKSQKLSDSTR